jgi:hypothetical protein
MKQQEESNKQIHQYLVYTYSYTKKKAAAAAIILGHHMIARQQQIS